MYKDRFLELYLKVKESDVDSILEEIVSQNSEISVEYARNLALEAHRLTKSSCIRSIGPWFGSKMCDISILIAEMRHLGVSVSILDEVFDFQLKKVSEKLKRGKKVSNYGTTKEEIANCQMITGRDICRVRSEVSDLAFMSKFISQHQ